MRGCAFDATVRAATTAPSTSTPHAAPSSPTTIRDTQESGKISAPYSTRRRRERLRDRAHAAAHERPRTLALRADVPRDDARARSPSGVARSEVGADQPVVDELGLQHRRRDVALHQVGRRAAQQRLRLAIEAVEPRLFVGERIEERARLAGRCARRRRRSPRRRARRRPRSRARCSRDRCRAAANARRAAA